MKNYYFFLSAALSILAVASCQKEVEAVIEEPSQTAKQERVGNIPFSLEANIIETKTALNTDTYAVTWEDSDIIYAVTTDSEWGAGTSSSDSEGDNVVEFAYADGRFSTSEVISDGSHTFNFLYSGNDQKKYHRGAVTTHQLYATQNFDANNPTSNLKRYDALVGQTTQITPAPLATVSFDHLYALMKVTLKNKTGEAITASKFEMTAEDADIVGVYTVTFGATPSVAIKSLGGDKVTVNISNGAIANNGELPIYFVIAPLEDFDGNITFTVTDSNDEIYTKTNTVADLSFTAGSYNTANFTLKPIPAKIFYKITDLSDLETGDYVIIGEKTSSSYGLLTYATLDSKRIPYSQSYTSAGSLPASIETKDGNSIWSLTVSGTSPKTVKVYNEANDKYLKADSGLSYVASSSATSFSVTASEGKFAFAASTTYLGVNKSSNWWRDYASSNLTNTHGLTLYKYWEESPLSSIALSGGYPTDFYVNDSFNYDGLIVTATYANGKTRTVTPTSVSTPDMSTPATGVTVTVSYTENAVTKTATYTIDIASRPQYTVIFMANGSEYDRKTVDAGPNLAFPDTDPDKSTYDFVGWTAASTINADGTGITYASAGDIVSADMTYYAVFSKDNVIHLDSKDVDFAPSDFSGGTSGTGSATSGTKDGVTISSNKGYATTQWRVYSGGSINVSHNMRTISTIAFTTNSSYGGGLSASYSPNSKTWSTTTSGQARITAIKVTLKAEDIVETTFSL